MEAVIRHALGIDIQRRLSAVLAGDVVKAKMPAPAIYLMVLDRVGISADRCLAVADTRSGMLAAMRAGMKCLVTVSDYSRTEDFLEASLVVSCLGEPEGEKCMMLQNRSSAAPGELITVGDLNRILEAT